MATTLPINGATFTVEPSGTDRDGRVKFTLRKIGGRGLSYETMRNANRPGLLFCVNPNATKLPNIWLTDEGGELRQVELA
jgi:hypothetical protein